ncbi:MAG: polysaccharide deacetylase family protein [Clostridia bacterium]|nr:polysaccharide deacetylase family protein [Clostridia bacterium]
MLKKRKKSKYKSNRLTLIVFAGVLIVAAIVAAAVLTAVPPLDEPKVSVTDTVADGVEADCTTQDHPYYTTSVTLPDASVSPYPAQMQQYVDAALADFHEQLQVLEDEKLLSKELPASFKANFTRSTFGGYYNYIVSITYNFSQAGSFIGNQRSIFLADAATGEQLTNDRLFVDGYDYKSAFAQALVKTLEERSPDADHTAVLERYSTDQTLYDGNIYLSENGVNLMVSGAESQSAPFVTVPYRSCYKKLNAVIPKEYLPKDPTPIDPTKEKVVALTFDDGPSSKVTPKLLDLLDKYNAKATFFLVGYNIDWQNDLVKEIAERGHTVANHSVEHNNYNKMSVSAAVSDVNTVFEKLESILGERPFLLRPPGGSMDKERAEAAGVPVILWDVDPLDWKYRDAETVSKNILKSVKSGDIVLSHDLYQSTYEAMEIVIPELKAQGYRFVTVDELLGINDGNYEYYAGKIITYRTLVKQLREDGLLEKQ